MNKRKEMLQKHIDDKCKAFAVWLAKDGWQLWRSRHESLSEEIFYDGKYLKLISDLYKEFSEIYVREMQTSSRP